MSSGIENIIDEFVKKVSEGIISEDKLTKVLSEVDKLKTEKDLYYQVIFDELSDIKELLELWDFIDKARVGGRIRDVMKWETEREIVEIIIKVIEAKVNFIKRVMKKIEGERK